MSNRGGSSEKNLRLRPKIEPSAATNKLDSKLDLREFAKGPNGEHELGAEARSYQIRSGVVVGRDILVSSSLLE